MEKSNKISERSFNFAIDIIKLYQELKNESEFVLSKQLLRSGTSIGANVREASAGSSKRDFLNKMSIASKEARETQYWLELLDKSQLAKNDLTGYLTEVKEIVKILTSIVLSTKQSLNQKSN